MRLALARRASTQMSTPGDLTIEGDSFTCLTLEPATPITAGTYEVVLTESQRAKAGHLWSPRADFVLPLLLHVPGHDGIRIHAGNSAADTEGCILVGDQRHEERLLNSRYTLIGLMAKLDAAQAAAERVLLGITNA